MDARRNRVPHRDRYLRVRLLFRLADLTRLGRGHEQAGVDLYLLPELVDGGYAALFKGRGIHREGDGTLESVRLASLRLSSTVAAGSVVLRSPSGERRNSSLLFHRGRRIHRYDKMHLFRPTGEERLFGGGMAARTFPLSLRRGTIRAAIILCYDLRFPDLTRLLARAGARILLVPARWPKVRDAAWRTLLRARAIENQIFVIGCNARGKEGGYSYAVDPFGREIFSSRRRGTAGLTIVCDLARLDEAREHHDNLREALPLILDGGTVRRLDGKGRAKRPHVRGK